MCLTAASLKGMLRFSLSMGASLALLSLPSRFGVRAGSTRSFLSPPPLGGGPGHAALQQLVGPITTLCSYTAPFLSAFWRFRQQGQWSSLNCHIMPTLAPKVIVRSKSNSAYIHVVCREPFVGYHVQDSLMPSSTLQVHNLSSPPFCGIHCPCLTFSHTASMATRVAQQVASLFWWFFVLWGVLGWFVSLVFGWFVSLFGLQPV